MNLENYYVPINPATKKAKELYRKILEKRHNKEFEEEEKEKEWPEYMHCNKCMRNKIDKLYLSETMKHIPCKTKSKGKTIIYYRHLCPKCIEKYKPAGERIGGHNF